MTPPIDFPVAPVPGEIYTFGSRSWLWNTEGWEQISTTFGPTGPTGPIGATGVTGPTGPQPSLSALNPLALGTASAGVGTSASADDHVHPTTGLVTTSGGSTITVASGTTVPLTIQNNGNGLSFRVNDQAGDTTPFVIDQSGNVAIGLPQPFHKLHLSDSTETQIRVDSSARSVIWQESYNPFGNEPWLVLAKNNGSIAGGPAPVTGNDILGSILFVGYSSFKNISASISANVDGTVLPSGSIPSCLVFSTTTVGTSAAIERMRIDNAGNVFIGTNVTAGQNTGGLTIQGNDIQLMTIMGAY